MGYRRDLWEGRAEQAHVVGCGTALSLTVSGDSLCRLPLQGLLVKLHRRYLPMVHNHGDVAFDPGFLSRVGL